MPFDFSSFPFLSSLLEAIDEAFRREVISALLSKEFEVPIFVSELHAALEVQLDGIVDLSALLLCLTELASKYHVLAVDDLIVRGEVRRAIGQLDRSKLHLLSMMLYSGRWKPLNLKHKRLRLLEEEDLAAAPEPFDGPPLSPYSSL